MPVRLVTWVGIALCAVAGRAILAQGPQAAVSPLPVVNQTDDPLLKRFVWRSIGPVAMGGRIDDIAPVENNPSIFYVGYATGGVWKTENNGTTFTPIFDSYPVSSIGDIAVAPSDPNVIYVGTGEPNNRQSSSFGAGVYKSTDGGKTFTEAGLRETQTIARIVVHPKDPNTVYVAALGHLFGPNPERGLFKSTDGGKTWTNTKFIDNDTGFTDVVMHPTNPNVLWAASYQRRRQPWGFNGGGPGSAIWRTSDAGKSWSKVTGNGLPDNPIIGRIGLDICRTKPNVILAQIEVGASGGTGAGVNEDGSLVPPGGRGGAPAESAEQPAAAGRGGQVAGAGRGGGGGGRGQAAPPDPKRSGVWRSDDGGKAWRFMSNNNNRPMYYSQIRIDPNNDQIIYTLGAGASKSLDGGKTFSPMGGQSHGDHHALWINPANSNHLLIGNDGGLDVSYDQGETWEEVSTMPTGQFYAISADMRKPYYVCGGLQDNGSWCGPSAVRSNTGSLVTDWYRIGGGDGFYTQNDPSDWTIGYSESQDGNTNRYDLKTGETQPIRPRGPSTGRGGGGRGAGGRGAAPTEPAPTSQAQQAQQAQPPAQQPIPGQPAAGGFGGGRGASPFGNIFPPLPSGTNPRFYWSTPFILSPHDPRILYLGGDRVFRSRARGDSWFASQDLTNNIGRNDRPIMGVAGDAPMASKHDGAASYSNIVTVSESPAAPGVVWVGTNDGNVQVSRDSAATFTNVVSAITGVPKETHVSRVEASHFDPGTAYVTFDGHRTDDHKPYVFRTTDFGKSWTSVAGNLPTGNVNVIREDPRNRNLLYVGTEYGFYLSLNGGREWTRFMNGLPTVRVDDILVHPRDNDLIVGTHGRSIYIIDDITPLQQLSDAVMSTDAHLFDIRPATRWVEDTMLSRGLGGAKHFRGANPPGGTAISYYLKSPASGEVKITISDARGTLVRELNGTNDAGINRIQWNLAPNPPLGAAPGRGGGFGGGRGGRGGPQFIVGNAVEPGAYIVKLSVGGKEFTTTAIVEPDDFR
ncbi:MAG: hypothetical protein WBC51_06275 [Vicinamibacterales bacterium]